MVLQMEDMETRQAEELAHLQKKMQDQMEVVCSCSAARRLAY